MKYASVTDRLANLGGAKWEVHFLARHMRATGHDVIEMTIGEPDVPTPDDLIETAVEAMRAGRTKYSDGQGEPLLLHALSERYSKRLGRSVSTDQILCFPGTQTALYAVLTALAETGDEVLVGDPMYATYEGVIRAGGATCVPVPLRPERGFRIDVNDIAARITPQSRIIFLNTPHNPSGAVLTTEDIEAIGTLAKKHDLWIVSDEVYEDLVFDGVNFISPLAFEDFAERTVVVSSISKSHAAPGFRSGWCVAPAECAERILPLSETMLFGNQPFIADMTAQAIYHHTETAQGMCVRFARRADIIYDRLQGVAGLSVHRSQAGMFILIDVSATGLSGYDYAIDLLRTTGVAVMPGTSFGVTLENWIRLGLTLSDDLIREACNRIASHALKKQE